MAEILALLNKFVALVKKIYDMFGMGGIFDELTRLISF